MIKDIKLQLKNGINEKEFKAIFFIGLPTFRRFVP